MCHPKSSPPPHHTPLSDTECGTQELDAALEGIEVRNVTIERLRETLDKRTLFVEESFARVSRECERERQPAAPASPAAAAAAAAPTTTESEPIDVLIVCAPPAPHTTPHTTLTAVDAGPRDSATPGSS